MFAKLWQPVLALFARRRKSSTAKLKTAQRRRLHLEPLEDRCLLTVTTSLVSDLNPGATGSGPGFLANLNGTVLFAATASGSDMELYKSNGTSAGTTLVKDINPGPMMSFPNLMTTVNNAVYFEANDGVNGYELWKTDGTSAGTVMVKNINPIMGAYPNLLANINGTLYFSADDGTHGSELWKSNGTSAGTVLVKDINPNATGSLNFQGAIVDVSGTAYFVANDGTNGYELWKSDGTSAGTVLVRNIGPTNAPGVLPSQAYLTNVNGTLFFVANDGVNGIELWKSDGTSAGTVMVKDTNTGGDGFPAALANINGTLFFSATDGNSNAFELWKSNGTSAGTTMVKNINTGLAQSSNPNHFTNVNGTAYFTADNGTNGVELWKTDGTNTGTLLVKDINTGGDSTPVQLTNVGGILFFQANSGPASGTELWQSDGSASGTTIVSEINAAGASSNPTGLINVNGVLFFSADDGTHGAELWQAVTPQVPGMGLSYNSQAIANNDVTPSSADGTDFGSTNYDPGQDSGQVDHFFTITNPGTGPLSLGTVTLTGANPGDFTVVQPASVQVAAGSSTSFRVTFKPTAIGTRTANVTFGHNATGSPFTFAIQGTGQQAFAVDAGNTLLTAVNTNLGPGPGTYDGLDFINGSTSDVDLFQFQGTAGKQLSIITSLPAGAYTPLDSYLRLFDASGTQLAFNDDLGTSGSASDKYSQILSYIIPSTGTYYVGVSAKTNTGYNPTNGTGAVQTADLGDYKLTIAMRDIVNVAGTNGDDTVSVQIIGNTIQTIINGIYQPNQQVGQFGYNIDLGGGVNQFVFVDQANAGEVVFGQVGMLIIAPNGQSVYITNSQQNYYWGSAQTIATVQGSAGNDVYYGYPNAGIMVYPGNNFGILVNATHIVVPDSTGNDAAVLVGTGGNDSFISSPTQSVLTNNTTYIQTLIGMPHVYAIGNGGTDTATLGDAATNDEFHALSSFSVLLHPNVSGFADFLLEPIGFHTVTAIASGGGTDLAVFYGTANTDTFTGSNTLGTLSNTTFVVNAQTFDYIYAIALNGATGGAVLNGTSGNDYLTANQADLQYYSYANGAIIQLYNFPTIQATSNGGSDGIHRNSTNTSYVLTLVGTWVTV